MQFELSQYLVPGMQQATFISSITSLSVGSYCGADGVEQSGQHIFKGEEVHSDILIFIIVTHYRYQVPGTTWYLPTNHLEVAEYLEPISTQGLMARGQHPGPNGLMAQGQCPGPNGLGPTPRTQWPTGPGPMPRAQL